MALFFGAISSGGSDNRAAMPIAVVDQDRTPYSRAFLAELRKSEALQVREAPMDSARLLVRRGQLVAYARGDHHGCVALVRELFPQLDQELDAWEAQYGWLDR